MSRSALGAGRPGLVWRENLKRRARVDDPRAVIGGAVGSWMVYGFKGLRYLVSRNYRTRVRAFWHTHPERRAGGIRRMILGAMLDVFIIACVVLAVASQK